MGGGKETPRQKMIGMMYLVLTALLALNVSASIMEKFAALNMSLENATAESDKRVASMLSNIAGNVKERGNKEHDVKVLNDAKKVQSESKRIIDHIESLKQELITKTGGMPDDGGAMPVGAKDNDKISEIMLKGGKRKEGKKLEKMLNDYVSMVNGVSKTERPKLALSGAEDPLTKKNKEYKKWTFADVNFEGCPLVAGLAIMSNYQNKVATIEAEVMNELASQVGASDHKLGELFAVVKPESKIVAAGTKYSAEMFISGTITGLENPPMKFNGKSIKVENGVGRVEFRVSGGSYNKEGKAKKTWKGSITVKDPLTGQDKEIPITEEYFVAKPVIQIQSASVNALYFKCGNELSVQVPALGSDYNPSFRATGAQSIRGSKKGFVTLVPNSSKVTLYVSSGGTSIGKQEFKVRLVPKPEIQALAKGKPVDEKKGMKAPGPRSITMKAIPDASFKQFLPKDARYKVTRWEAILVRGKRPVATQKFKSSKGSLASFAAQARPGDRILIEVKQVKRLNFRNKAEDVKLGTILKNVPLTD